MDALPVVLQENIAAILQNLGSLHILNLRACSKQWRNICSSQIQSASIPAQQLADAIPFLNALSSLDDLTLRHKNPPAVDICGDVLSSLQAKLKTLSFTSDNSASLKSFHTEGEEGEVREAKACTICIPDLRILLQPWHESLEHLHLDHCQITVPDSESRSPDEKSLFSQLPLLHTLHITSSHISVNGETTPWLLNLDGCTSLKILDCCDSNVSALNLPGCVALESLFCSNNQLLSLNLSQSEHLRHLQCSFNNIKVIQLTDSASLDTLTCDGHNQQAVFILGGVSVRQLECAAPTFAIFSLALRHQLVRLHLSDESSMGMLFGFQDLKFLKCSFLEGSVDYLDVSGCSNVELDCCDNAEYFIVEGCENVKTLTLTKLGKSPLNLNKFTCLQNLHLKMQHGGIFDLRKCRALHKVRLEKTPGSFSSTAVFDLSGCALLEELCCDNYSTLSELSLTGCVGLKSVSCVNSNLQSLDVSWSRCLLSLDVSGSKILSRLLIRKGGVLLDLKSERCGNLAALYVKQQLHDAKQQGEFARRFVSSGVAAHLWRDMIREWMVMMLCVAVPVALGYIIYLMGGMNMSK